MIIEGKKATYVPVDSGVPSRSNIHNATTPLYIWLYNPLSMHNICNKISTNLQYGNENGKLIFIQTNVTSSVSFEKQIQSNLTKP